MSVRGSLLACLAGAALLAGCAPSDRETDYLARKALLERQNQGIRELIAEAEQGSLVPADRFLIGIDEKVIGDLFRYQLPIERPIGKNFVVHLDSAQISLRDKFGVITLDGDLHRPQTPDRKTAVRIHGGLGGISVDSTSKLLSLRVAIDRIELRQAGLLEGVLGHGGKKFLAEKGRGLLQDALPEIKVPVSLAQKIRIPAIQDSSIALDSLTVPLDMSVERVLAVGGKLWVTLDARVGRVTGAEEGIGVAVKKKPKKRPASGGAK